jgi:hypothetical protein
MPDLDTQSIDSQLNNLRSSISDLGHRIDSHKTTTAATLSGGVFLLLLAAGAAYDLVAGKSAVWLALGMTREDLIWVASGLGGGAMLLLALSFVRLRGRDRSLDARLDRMEQEYAELLEHKDGSGGSRY